MTVEELTAERERLEQRLEEIDTELDRLSVFEHHPHVEDVTALSEAHQAEVEP